MITKKKSFYNSIIPSDWNTPEFGSVFSFLKSFSFSREQLTNVQTTGEIQNIHYGDIHTTFVNGILDFELESRIPYVIDGLISKEVISDKDFPLLKEGDLIIADASEDYEGVCDCVELKNLNRRKITSGLHTFAARGKNELISLGFRAYALKNEQVIRELRRIATGISVYGVSKTNLSKVKIPLPPLQEQKQIAYILGLMDSAINTNNQLITQKELRKKWLMQNLLTGKKRLKSFEGKWKTFKASDHFEFVKTYSISRDGLTKKEHEGFIYCIHYGDIHAVYEDSFLDFTTQQGIPKIVDETHSLSIKDYLIEGDVIMADASEDYEGVGEVVEVLNLGNKKAVGGLHTIVLRGNQNFIVNKFRGYLFSSEIVRNKLRKMATGTSVYSVTKNTLNNLIVSIPQSLNEQTAIVQVLQTADKELQLLKAKKEKLREQKKALMQQLLTGKIRINYE